MNFGALPPEINSGRMYSGPGAEPMLQAAAAWEQLTGELYSAAGSMSSVISVVAGDWRGPSSAAMAAAATTYASWLTSVAMQAQSTATQALAAAGAFEAAFAATVPPPVIAANRALLAMLVATNFLGLNTTAIMATEAHYAEMWALDAAALYGYAAASAEATTLAPFTAPPQIADPAGLGAQLSNSVKDIASSAGISPESIIQQIITDIHYALAPDHINSAISAYSTIPSIILSAASLFSSIGARSADTTAQALTDVGVGLGRVASNLGSVGSAIAAGRIEPMVSAGLGRAATIGSLSVPRSWAATASPLGASGRDLPVTLVSAEQDLGALPPPISMAAPGSVAAGRSKLAPAEGTTLRALMRTNVLPRPYVG